MHPLDEERPGRSGGYPETLPPGDPFQALSRRPPLSGTSCPMGPYLGRLRVCRAGCEVRPHGTQRAARALAAHP
jgi:hypothetical protein